MNLLTKIGILLTSGVILLSVTNLGASLAFSNPVTETTPTPVETPTPIPTGSWEEKTYTPTPTPTPTHVLPKAVSPEPEGMDKIINKGTTGITVSYTDTQAMFYFVGWTTGQPEVWYELVKADGTPIQDGGHTCKQAAKDTLCPITGSVQFMVACPSPTITVKQYGWDMKQDWTFTLPCPKP